MTWAGRLPVRRPRIFLEVLVLLLGFYAVSAIRSPYPGYSMGELGYFFSLFLLYLLATQVYTTPAHVRGLIYFFCAGLALAAAYAFLQKLGLMLDRPGLDPFPWGDKQEDIYTNLPGTFGNPNFAAHALILGIILAAYAVSRGAVVWGGGMALIFLCWLWMTDQRAGWLGLGAALALVVLAKALFPLRRMPVVRAVSTLLISALLIVAAALGYLAMNRAAHGSALPVDGSLLLRYNGYLSASEMVLDHPLNGHGPGVYAIDNPQYWTSFERHWFASEMRMNARVHNDILEVAVDAGLPAAGLYLVALILGMGFGLVMAFTAVGPGRRRLGYAFTALFAAFLVDGLFGFNLRVPVSASVLFLAFGLLDGMYSPGSVQGPIMRGTGLPRPPGMIWRIAVGAFAVFVLFWSIRVFASEVWMMQGLRAHNDVMQLVRMGPEQRRRTDPERAAEHLRVRAEAAMRAFDQGAWLAPWNHHFEGRRGEVLTATQDFDGAIAAFQAALTKNPHYLPTLTRLGNALVAQVELNDPSGPNAPAEPLALLDRAEEAARQILVLCPELPRGEDLMGRVYASRARLLEAGNRRGEERLIEEYYREAEEHFTRAIQFGARNHVELYRLIADMRGKFGDAEGREEALLRAIQANPADEYLWEPLFNLVREPGGTERLRNTLYRVLTGIRDMETPNVRALTEGYLALADDLVEAGDLKRADDAYRDAVLHGPGEARAWAEFGQYAQKQDRVDVFTEALDKAAAAHLDEDAVQLPALSVAYLVLAEIEETHRSNADAAYEAYRQAVRFGPGRPDTWTNFANFAKEKGRMADFEQVLRESVARCLEHGPAPLLHVRAVNDVIENGASALDAATAALLQQYREYPPDKVQLAATHLAWTLQFMLSRMAALTPEDTQPCLAYLNMGIMLNGFQQFETADALFPAAMQCLSGDNLMLAGTHWTQTMFGMDRPREAMNLLEDLRRRFPENPDLQLVYAQALARSQQIPEAIREYDQLLDLPHLPPAIRQQLQKERDALR
jgi:tetratricopeptide (TPR) repeat protein